MRNRKLFFVIIVVTVLVLIISWAVVAKANRLDEDKLYKVVRVIDGDTFDVKIGWKTATVRMLGIDTPETVDPRKDPQCFGKEASDETKTLLVGHSVQLKKNPNRELKDRYGRYLLYVYRDGLFVNEYLVANGFAREYTYGSPYVFRDDFRKKEDEAKHDKRGLWLLCVNE